MKKQYELKEYKEINDEVIRLLASDETVDRDNDVIKVDGWDYNNWLKSGSVLYGHDPSNLPVGSAEGAEIRDGSLYLYTRLAQKGTSEWHDAIRSLLEQKVLKGVSVGFKAMEYEPNEFGGRNFTKAELLEVSLTPVPANPNARALVKEYSEEVQDALLNKQDNIEDNMVEDETLPEETQVVEPEPQEDEASDREERFLSLYNKLKSIYGE